MEKGSISMEKQFETEVLTRLALIESKLDGYKEIKKIIYENSSKCRENEQDITELKTRIAKIEEKPNKRYDDIVKLIITFIVNTILFIVAVKIGLK